MTLRTNLCLLPLTLGEAFSSSSSLFNLFSSPLFCILSNSYRDMDDFMGFSLYLFFLSYQRNALRAQQYPCPLTLFSFSHNISCDSEFSFWTWWLMKQPSLNHTIWASGYGWWAVEGYHVRGFTIQKSFTSIVMFVPSHGSANLSATIFNELLILNDWRAFCRLLFGEIRVVCLLIRLSAVPCNTESWK